MFGSALAGCKKGQNENGEIVCDRNSYIAQSKEYKPTEGEGLVLAVTGREPIVEGYFGKPYNQDWLAAVGHASILETIDYIETKGVKVYHSDPISTKSALNLESTPVMPWDVDREWRRADKPAAGSACGFLAGLYLPMETRGLPSLRGRSAIIAREDAGRWTLIHEFMHHNFKTQAAVHGYNDDEAQNTRLTLLREIEALKKDHSISNKEYAQKMSALFQRLIDVADLLVVQYQFEEVTIEATLQDKYEKGDLGYVPAGAYANATWYIAHSQKNAEDMYKSMTATYDELYRLTSTNNLFDDWRKLRRYVSMRDRRLAQLGEVIAKRQSVAGFAMGLISGANAITPADGFVPCAHARAIEDEMNKIAESMRSGRDGI